MCMIFNIISCCMCMIFNITWVQPSVSYARWVRNSQEHGCTFTIQLCWLIVILRFLLTHKTRIHNGSTFNPARSPAHMLVKLALRHCCFFPAFIHCCMTERSESIPWLSWEEKVTIISDYQKQKMLKKNKDLSGHIIITNLRSKHDTEAENHLIHQCLFHSLWLHNYGNFA